MFSSYCHIGSALEQEIKRTSAIIENMKNSTFQFGECFRLENVYPNCINVIVPLFGYIFPVYAALAVSMNVLASVVFLQPRVRSHTACILTLIACADTLNILAPTFTYVYYYTLGHYKEYFSYRLCFLSYFLSDVCLDFFNALSLCLTVLLAYIRCRCLKEPFTAHTIHTSKRVIVYVACILTFTVLSHLPSLFLFDFSPAYKVDPTTNITMEVCVITESNFLFSNSSIGRKFQVYTSSVLDSILPCGILVYLDFVILLTLKEAKQIRRSLRRGVPMETQISDKTGKTSRDKQRHFKLNSECFSTLVQCGRFKDDSENGNSTEQQETVVFCEASDTSLKQRYKSISCCFFGNCICLKHTSCKRKAKQRIDSAYEKLDRDSRRTSWLIFAVATIVSLHEIPLAVTTLYTLVKHYGVSLPFRVYGCLNVIILIWQYVTYLVIFLIYAFMSGAFRKELKRIFTYTCRQESDRSDGPKKVFMSPCSVRKTVSREEDVTAEHFQDSDL